MRTLKSTTKMNTSFENSTGSSISYDEKQFLEINIDSDETSEKQIPDDSGKVPSTQREVPSLPDSIDQQIGDNRRQSCKSGTEKAKYQGNSTHSLRSDEKKQFPKGTKDCDETEEKQIVWNSHSSAEVSDVHVHRSREIKKNKQRVDFDFSCECRREPLTDLFSSLPSDRNNSVTIHHSVNDSRQQTKVKCTYSENRHCYIYQQMPGTRGGVKSLPANCSENADRKRRLCKSDSEMGYGMSLLVSFADDSESHLHEVYNLSNKFQRLGFEVHNDHPSFLVKQRIRNLNDWRDDHFKNAHKILICISPKYYEYIQSPGKESNEDSFNCLRSSVRYVFDLARSEYKDNYCEHNRFLPILFKNSGAKYPDHFPGFLKSAYIETERTEDILNRI